MGPYFQGGLIFQLWTQVLVFATNYWRNCSFSQSIYRPNSRSHGGLFSGVKALQGPLGLIFKDYFRVYSNWYYVQSVRFIIRHFTSVMERSIQVQNWPLEIFYGIEYYSSLYGVSTPELIYCWMTWASIMPDTLVTYLLRTPEFVIHLHRFVMELLQWQKISHGILPYFIRTIKDNE